MSEIVNNISIIENVEISTFQQTIGKINQFQNLVKTQLSQNHDYGIIPGTPKPTLLKPGAEKILMLMGLSSEFDVLDSTRDFKAGFFQYQIKCKLFKNGVLITEGLGSCNTMERKYVKMDAFTMDNTVLKMAKKRALIDATLLIASLSQIFSQDLEDVDLAGEKPTTGQIAFDSPDIISSAQAKRMYAISKGNTDVCKDVLRKFGYEKSGDVKKVDYEKICEEIETQVA